MATASKTFHLTREMPRRVLRYPQLRFMGSKYRLLSWIYDVLSDYEFDTTLDAFTGSGCVAYLFKAMGRKVHANDFLNFSATIAKATIENPGVQVSEEDVQMLLAYDPRHRHFIEQTFTDIFFTREDLRFLDRVWGNIDKLDDPYKQAITVSALIRSCAKRQPRGVFTVAGDPERYKDGRRDVRLSLREHFPEHIAAYNACSFDNGKENRATRGDVFDLPPRGVDLVYMDPPYVPRSDDNCYVKRYHFLEGLSNYWRDAEIMHESRVKKIKKRYTPFSYRRTSIDAFDTMFSRFSESILVLSYSSNGYPDLNVLVELMGRYKCSVEIHEREHRYHFGTHKAAARNQVREYLIVGC